MKVVIFGSTGFIGSAITTQLKKNKAFVVFTPQKHKCNLEKKGNVIQYIAQIQPEIIINAAFIGVDSSRRLTQEYTNKNLKIVKNILIASQSSKSLIRVIQFGSSLEYDDSDKKISEKYMVNPHNSYASLKAMLTFFALGISKERKIPLILIRPFNLYGPGDTKSVFFYITSSILANKPLSTTKGNQIRDYLYIEDFAQIIEKIILTIQKTQLYEIYNIGSGKATKLKDMFASFFRELKYKEIPIIKANQENEYWYQVADNSKLKKIITFPLLTPQQSGITKTVKWIKTLKKVVREHS